MRKICNRLILSTLIFTTASTMLIAQQSTDTLSQTILRLDSAFWNTYNTCDVEKFKTYFANDVEFYHDKGGITLGLEKLASSLKDNLCANPNSRIWREPLKASIKVFPLRSGSNIYGAILSGEHWFYAVEPGKDKKRTGGAKFTHLWLLNDGAWKMKRVLSFDHVSLPPIENRKEISLSNDALNRFAGTYEGPKTGRMITTVKDGFLLLTIQEKSYALYPETNNRFFLKERDVVFEFLPTDAKKVSKMLVSENGTLVEEAKSVARK